MLDSQDKGIDYESFYDSIEIGGDPDCKHEWEWKGGRSDPAVRCEPEQACKHCGAINLGDDQPTVIAGDLPDWISCGMDEAAPCQVTLTFATPDDAYAYYQALMKEKPEESK